MENVGVSKQTSVITVLTEGKKLAKELKRKLHPDTASRESCDVLLESILSSYENAITLLALLGNPASSQIAVGKLFEPPNSAVGSPTSEGSEQNCKKRKTLPRWVEQVRVCSETGSEGQLEDGYNWRKYGQKDILGSVHPRAYYRCTHRNTQGCLATKQVQRADEDPAVFEVVYRGKHSCRQVRLKQNELKKDEKMGGSLIKTENRELDSKEEHSPSFSFPSTPIDYQSVEPHFFSDTTSDFITTSYSPSFLSPATSDFGIGQSLQSSESDFGEIISNPTHILEFPSTDLDLAIDVEDFECHFLDAFDFL